MTGDSRNILPRLFSPLDVGPVHIPNRVVSTGHHTYMADDIPSDALIAYHEARAKGGTGLIITEVVAVHETAAFSSKMLTTTNRDCIPAYRRLTNAVHTHGTKIFGQLFHPGREILRSTDGLTPVAYAPSSVPNERFHIMPKPMSVEMIEEIIEGHGNSAAILAEAGYDGVEIVGSHGYLPAQFFNPQTNLRDDKYGGDFERRLRFVRDAAKAVRHAAPSLALGLRISGDEMDSGGLDADTIVVITEALAADFDYFSVVAGTSAALGASVHITPPMGVKAGYTAPYARRIKDATRKPVIATGRINQPQIAETILAAGDADLCGMTRALITDPDMPSKAQAGAFDTIRACIGCNQSCIGRAHKGVAVSCLQNPRSGRETQYTSVKPAPVMKDILVVGGGPAGMKAAAMAGARGHRVHLVEAGSRLGGQALLAQSLPGREEFGGVVTNFLAEMEEAGVRIEVGQRIEAADIVKRSPDAVIVATGATPYTPSFEGIEEAHIVTAWDVLQGRANIGRSVVIADWKADWIGLGLAERLVLAGSSVTLCTNAAMAGETLQLYTRNHYVGRLHKLGVSIRTHTRFFGVDGDTAYFEDTLSGDPILIEGTDTVVLALGHISNDGLAIDLADAPFEVIQIGDCLSPRTAEEAILEGFIAGSEV